MVVVSIGAFLLGFCSTSVSFVAFWKTHLYQVAVAFGASFALVFGFLVPGLFKTFPFLGPLGVDIARMHLVPIQASILSIRFMYILSGILSVLLGTTSAIVPGCMVRYVCCESEQGWWSEWVLYGIFGAVFAALFASPFIPIIT